MKILKKFLIIGLFSFLFIINVYAVTNFTNTNITTLDNYINNHQGSTDDKIEEYKESILDYITLPSDEYISDNYIIALNNSSQSSTSVQLYYLSSTYYQNIAYNYNYGNKALYFNNNNSGKYNECYKTLNFNSNGEIISQGNWTCMEWEYSIGIMSNNYQWYIISTNYPYFTYKRPTWDTDSFSIANGTEYVFETSQIPVNFLNGNKYNINVNDYYNPPNPYACELDPSSLGGFREASVTNVSSFSVRLTGVISSAGESFDGSFALKRNDLSKINDPNLTVNLNAEQLGDTANEYLFAATSHWYNDENVLIVNYSFGDFSSNNTEFDIIITLTPNDNSSITLFNGSMSVYYCNPLNLTYDDTSYGYIDNTTGTSFSTDTSLLNYLNDNNINGTNSFFDEILSNENFSQDHGITAIIQAPINFLQTLNNKTCQSIVLPIPYFGNATIPCMSTIYSSKFLDLYNVIKLIINGLLCYRIALSVVMIVKEAKNPNSDKIEVMDL